MSEGILVSLDRMLVMRLRQAERSLNGRLETEVRKRYPVERSLNSRPETDTKR